VIAFSLFEPEKAANSVQIATAVEEVIEDNASTTTASVTIHNPSEENVLGWMKKKEKPRSMPHFLSL